MKTYEVTYYRTYIVEANSEEEAKTLAHEDAKFDFSDEAEFKRDDFPYLFTEHVQRIIEEELQQVLREQGFPQGIAQDIPTGGAPPPPPAPPVFDRRGREITQADLDELGFGSHEEFFEENPSHHPQYIAEPEPIQRYPGGIPMGERGATILRQTGRDL